MTKGTPSFGKKNKRTHMRCRRCGSHSYHVRKRRCSHCGFGRSRKKRGYSWSKRS
ncbi:MAG: 50S ribosomal protein L37e [Theionarchaea archaeon]|nr:MAG: 50S ribosomal protein L37 [Theionarchaea archaeon DG-70-1]MBU7027421.1 50S ribosomal protein L37e [Theionarchaea archaeon]